MLERSVQRQSFGRNRERGFGWAWVEGCEVQGSLQSKQRLTEGPFVWVRVGQGRGQQHQDVKCDRSILGFQHRSPSPALNQVSGSGVKGRTAAPF